MSDYEFIPPQTTPAVTFGPEPAYNALSSLMLLNEDLSGFGHWVQRTAASMSPEQLETNRLVCGPAAAYLDGAPWPSFPAWLDDISARDPDEMRSRTLEAWLDMLRRKLGAQFGNLPKPEALIADRAAYLSVKERAYQQKGHPFDPSFCEAEHEFLQDAVARQDRIVSHLRRMWDEYLALEWERNLPLIGQSVAAFESMDYGGLSIAEAIRHVTARDLAPREWEGWLPDVERLIFIPSAHLGPYLLLMDFSGASARIVLGARIPQGATVVSAALTRSELLTRLSALADDTRLRILELLASEGELGAQDVIARLDISQSSVSRHLRQLSATGYLVERRREGAKVYRLNPERLDDTLGDLKTLLR